MPKVSTHDAVNQGRDNGGGQVRHKRSPCGADGGAELPIKGSQQVMIQDVSVDAHVVHGLGHVSPLPGEHHFSGGVVNARDGRAHFVTSAHRLPCACVDLLARATGGPESWLKTVQADRGAGRSFSHCHARLHLITTSKSHGRMARSRA